MKKTKRQIFSFSKGINTDAPATVFPPDFALDEMNFDILSDGTRARRKGLYSIGGEDNLPDYEATAVHRVFKWASVNGDPDMNLVVIQIGALLYFYNDTYPISTDVARFILDMAAYAADETATISDIISAPLDCAASKGILYVTGRYIEPQYIKYNSTDDVLDVTKIELEERDFEGMEDGIADDYEPSLTEGNDNAQFQYNLVNMGWTATNLDTHKSVQGKWPAKSMAYYLGFRRKYDTGYAEDDGTQEFSSTKLINELLSAARGPVGHVIRSPFNTKTIRTESGATNVLGTITGAAISNPDQSIQTITLTMTAEAHGLVSGDIISVTAQPCSPLAGERGTTIQLENTTLSRYRPVTQLINISGNYPVTVINANVISIQSQIPQGISQYVWELGGTDNFGNPYAGIFISGFYFGVPTYYTSSSIGEECPFRPRVCAVYAGRVWYAGVDFSRWTGKLYYSQILETPGHAGRCYQQADPTNGDISDLAATDGGAFNIQEAGTIHTILPYSSKLLIFSENGVWELGPGNLGYFSPTSYIIRKISEVGVYGAGSAVIADNVPVYWGKSSIYKIVADPQQGFLISQNISSGKVDNLFQSISITAKQNAQVVYNDLRKQIMWCYRADSTDVNYYDRILIYDLKFDAFTKWSFSSAQISAFVTFFSHRDVDISVEENKIIVLLLGRTMTGVGGTVKRSKFAKFSRTDSYVDQGIGGAEQEAYLITGYDCLNSPEARKQAPIITVYMNKTEDGYTLAGDIESVWDSDIFQNSFWNWNIWTTYTGASEPRNQSSVTMQARWDWSDNSSAGKWGTAQQVYRHPRMYLPTGPDDTFDDGQPVVVSRNKVRGRGRSLHLKFTAGVGKNAWLIGWTTNYTTLQDD